MKLLAEDGWAAIRSPHIYPPFFLSVFVPPSRYFTPPTEFRGVRRCSLSFSF